MHYLTGSHLAARDEGKQAYYNGQPCPYWSGTDEHHWWHVGYSQAAHQNTLDSQITGRVEPSLDY